MDIENILTTVAYIISFSVTFFLTPLWIRYATHIKLVGRDMHKINHTLVPEAGGLVILCGIFLSLFYYAGIKFIHFHNHNQECLIMILSTFASLLLVAIIGIMDDFRGWKMGLKQWQKPLLTIPAALPFLLANLKRTTIDIPFIIGEQNIGYAVPLLFIPMAIVGASNAFNMLAGYNGLEVGMGMIILGALGFLSYLKGQYLAVVLGLIGFSALLAFIIYNWYPSKIFPGDTMTYPIGAFIAICALLGRVEKFGLLLFIPYFLDFFLPLRKGMKVEAFAEVAKDGSFEPPYESIYDITHLVIFLLKKIKKKVYEKEVVLTILGFELFLAIACVILYFLIPQY